MTPENPQQPECRIGGVGGRGGGRGKGKGGAKGKGREGGRRCRRP